jgi:DNA-binding transcriptional LysR family regulator
LLKRFNICANSFGFNEAAKKIGTSPSALLGQIETLEKVVGYNLFERVNKNRSKVLTPEGELLKQATQQIFLFLSVPLSEQAQINRAQRKVLRVVTTEGLSKTLLFKPLNDYLDQNPEVQLQLVTKSSAEMIEPGEVVIRTNFIDQKHVRREYLLSFYFKLFASREYIEAYGMPDNPLDLVNHKMLMMYTQGNTNTAFHWRSDYNIYFTPEISSDSFEYLLMQCHAGRGIFEIADLYLDRNELVDVFPDMQGEEFELYVAYNKKSSYEQLVPSFVKFLKKALGDKTKGSEKDIDV